MSSGDWTTALTKNAAGETLLTTDQALQLKGEVGIQQQSMESLLIDKFNILDGLANAINDLVKALKAGNTGESYNPDNKDD